MKFNRPSSVAAAVLAVLYGVDLHAQQTDESGSLQEVVVTATRRSEKVSDVPYNITAVSGQALENMGLTDTNSLVRAIPGLANFDDGARGSGLRNTYSMRGLNADAANNEDDNPRLNQPTVSTYLGDTPVFFPLKLVDLDRVEVLRGPQGTLYGSGSIGGTLRFIPKKAQLNEWSADVTVESSHTGHASDLGHDERLTVNVPVGERAALRGTAGYERVAGFIDAVGLVQQTGTARDPGAVVLANPSQPLTSPAAVAPPRLDNNDAHILYAQAQARLVPSDGIDITLDYHHQETHANDRSQDNPFYGTHQAYVRYAEFASPEDAALDLIRLDVQFSLGFATMASSTAYSGTHASTVSGDASGFLQTNLAQYYFGYPRLIAPESRSETHSTFTQEVRLVSTGSHAVDWVVGAFYLRDRLAYSLSQNMPGINYYTNTVLGLTSPVDFTDILSQGGTNQAFQDAALFGEPTWHITDRWNLVGGVRVFHQTLQGISGIALPYASRTTQYFQDGVANNDYLLGGPVSTHNITNNHVFKLNTSYRVAPGALAYATYSEGFRAGGANALPQTDLLGDNNSAILHFRPDSARNYEFGVKGDIARRLQYDVTAFYVDWKDFQTTLYTPLALSYIGNVSLARSHGLEAQASGYFVPDLNFDVGYTYARATVGQAFSVVPGDATTRIEPGTPLPNAPKQSVFASLSYTERLGSSSIVYQVDGSYRSAANSFFRPIPSLATDNFQRLGGFTVWDSSVSWVKGPFRTTFFGHNLSSTRGTTIVSTAKSLGGRDQGQGVLAPRTLGVRLEYSFD